ncbi:DUF1501 domain-containing protein [Calycomorphotria hydatis]|uniref:Sulfatase n=1 Tax=Calycomorphotria hydatis TaxID=2528027 RepID=A0A517TER6_9PLAN|nr:DUF1501 domain-containing protein [Calycomorphotria hydatis]QDT66871.1 hypothetical protein V22_41430 [Calycomorphotria hydatis]
MLENSLNRRDMLMQSGVGMGAVALSAMLQQDQKAFAANTNTNPLAPSEPHFAPRAKQVIHLFQTGGPSHVDTFDYKPALEEFDGKTGPISLKTERPTGTVMKSPWEFKKHGESGIMVSDLFPHLAKCVDDICVIRSMKANVPNHEPSLNLMNCGASVVVRPAVGSWVTYGLGSENQNLPGFIVMCPNGFPTYGTQNWNSSFLPGVYQGTYINPAKTNPKEILDNLKNPFLERPAQRRQLDLLKKLNDEHLTNRGSDPNLEAAIQSYELAFRMQFEASDAFDISQEPESMHELYGTKDSNYAKYVLMTRRLIERGVRYVQLYQDKGQPWDSHNKIEKEHGRLAKDCDQANAALLIDLKQRGLLDDTLVICGGEFGRTPTVELPTERTGKVMLGRDHNHHGFSIWMAGGGVKGGMTYGTTDELGFAAVENPVHVHDLHATILHLLGFDHKHLTYRYAGRDFRLTDVHGVVVKDILA